MERNQTVAPRTTSYSEATSPTPEAQKSGALGSKKVAAMGTNLVQNAIAGGTKQASQKAGQKVAAKGSKKAMDAVDATDKTGLPSTKRATPKVVVNPFQNTSWSERPCWWKVVETLFGVVMFPIRVVIMIPVLLFGFTFSAILQCVTPKGHPVEPNCIQTMLLIPIRIVIRVWLWCLGVWWISLVHKPGCSKSRIERRIIVGNHVGLIDPVILVYLYGCSVVSKAEVRKLPMAGGIATALGSIFVARKDPESKAKTLEAIEARTKNPKLPSLAIFPEGTCTNQKTLIQFKRGAFVPKSPVQPVTFRYQTPFLNIGACGDMGSLMVGFFRMMLQPWIHPVVTLLPLQGPDTPDQHPNDFAAAVRATMAADLGVPVTEHSLQDMFLYRHARQHHLKFKQNFEATNLNQLFGLKYDQLTALLTRFSEADVDNSGSLSIEELCAVVGVETDSAEGLRVFRFFDKDGDGTVDYVEFAQGITILSEELDDVDHLRLAFSILAGGDGLVSTNDLKDYMNHTATGLGMVAQLEVEGNHSPAPVIRRVSSSASIASLASVISAAEGLEDQRVNFEQFVLLAHSKMDLVGPLLEAAHQLAGNLVKNAGAEPNNEPATTGGGKGATPLSKP